MKKIAYQFGFPRIHRLIIYCILIAILGFIIYFINGNANLSDVNGKNDDHTTIVGEEFEDMFHLAAD